MLPAKSMIEGSAFIASASSARFVPHGHVVVALVAVTVVAVCVLMHYEVLRGLSRFLARLKQIHRLRVLVLILGLILTHIIEIWVFALAYGLTDWRSDFGHLATAGGGTHAGWLDYIYFSFVTYTTVGYGDIVPAGPIRFIAATEALTGWVLLGWSVSFTFLEMQRFWHEPAK